MEAAPRLSAHSAGRQIYKPWVAWKEAGLVGFVFDLTTGGHQSRLVGSQRDSRLATRHLLCLPVLPLSCAMWLGSHPPNGVRKLDKIFICGVTVPGEARNPVHAQLICACLEDADYSREGKDTSSLAICYRLPVLCRGGCESR
jgi:hypothetical protein